MEEPINFHKSKVTVELVITDLYHLKPGDEMAFTTSNPFLGNRSCMTIKLQVVSPLDLYPGNVIKINGELSSTVVNALVVR